MIRISITPSLSKAIQKTFSKGEAREIQELFCTLKEQPRKGKLLGTVQGLHIKEIKYRKYRFYFLVDGERVRLLDRDTMVDLLIRFVRMSDKKRQQETIDEIKRVLRAIGPEGLA